MPIFRDRYSEYPSHPDDDYYHAVPENSYSRQLDSRVQAQEMPYGYSFGEPSADTRDFAESAYESHVQYPLKKGKAI